MDVGHLVRLDDTLRKLAPEHHDGVHPGALTGAPMNLARHRCSVRQLARAKRLQRAIGLGIVTAAQQRSAVADLCDAGEVLGLEQKDTGRCDDDVVVVAPSGVDLLDNRPAVARERAVRLGFALGALPPVLDIRRATSRSHSAMVAIPPAAKPVKKLYGWWS